MNYDLLFMKCMHHDIDLRWVVYGEDMISSRAGDSEERMGQIDSGDDSSSNYGENLELAALEHMRMIRDLPWSVTVKRKMMENYIMLLYEDHHDQLDNQQLKNA